MHPISVSAEKIFTLFGSFPITNSLFATWVVMAFLIITTILAVRKKQLVPKGLYNVVEAIIEGFLSLFESVLDNVKLTRKVFPLVATIFIFVLFSNWFGLLPGVGAIGFTKGHEAEFVPLLRAGTSDLSLTLAIALFAVIFVQVMGVANCGLSYFKKFIDFSGPIQFFVGILELLSDFAKIISFSFRLFGNIFAGEVLLVVITFLVPYIAPIPFYGLEVFVGVVQALVFAMLTLVFVKLAVVSHH